MELRHLKYFMAVAETLNFTRAAEKLHTAQPSLSQQIRDLEGTIGTPLFYRTKRKVELTRAGEIFLEEARLTLAQADRALMLARAAAGEHRHAISIGFVPCAEVRIFPHILPVLRSQFPDLKVILKSLPNSQQLQALLGGSIDVAFMRTPPPSHQADYETVLSERLIAVLPATHPLAGQKTLDIRQLQDTPFIGTDPDTSDQLVRIVTDYFARHEVDFPPIQRASNVLFNLTLIGTGVGFGLLPAYVRELGMRNVSCIPLADGGPQFNLLMVTRKAAQSPSLSGFCALVREAASNGIMED